MITETTKTPATTPDAGTTPAPGNTPETAPLTAPETASATAPETAPAGTWSDLLGRRHRAAALVLASGVALYATNEYVTASLMPSVVRETGGERFYAWVTTGFLIASVVSSMLVARTLTRWGARTAYTAAFAIFALGSLINTVAPGMEFIVAGRVVQGFGGGLLAGFGYAMIRGSLPAHLWAVAAGLVSSMWAVGNIAGPSLGGVFAELGVWRAAFGAMVLLPLLLALVARRAMPHRDTDAPGTADPLPWRSLILLTLTAMAFSLASVAPKGAGTAVGVGAGLVLLLAFVVSERRGTVSVLPARTYRNGNPLKWVYLAIGAMTAAAMTEMFTPLFGQRLGGLTPLVAGFFGAVISVGWTTASLFSVKVASDRVRRAVVGSGLLVLTAGLAAYGALQSADASGGRVLLWALALLLGGAGIGMVFPHMSMAAMSSASTEEEGRQAAAGISTSQLIANAVASALAGILVNLGSPDMVRAAQYMAFGIALVALLGAVAATLSQRSQETPAA
ncbi:MFS transporter [Streptomyces sp. NPDC090025]|uniref:MFS transporter n=1 Tax=Streptomyces sp. NPDC090025 TaxID=3365922 RepID=UPI0038377B58